MILPYLIFFFCNDLSLPNDLFLDFFKNDLSSPNDVDHHSVVLTSKLPQFN